MRRGKKMWDTQTLKHWALKALKFNIGNTTIEILDLLRLQTPIEMRDEEKKHTHKLNRNM